MGIRFEFVQIIGSEVKMLDPFLGPFLAVPCVVVSEKSVRWSWWFVGSGWVGLGRFPGLGINSIFGLGGQGFSGLGKIYQGFAFPEAFLQLRLGLTTIGAFSWIESIG